MLSGSCWKFSYNVGPSQPAVHPLLRLFTASTEPQKKPVASFDFPLNPGCLIGILVNGLLKKHTTRQLFIPYTSYTPED